MSFKCNQPLEVISKINNSLSDIRRWMVTNKLTINELKTEFIVFRSLQLRSDLSGLSVNLGETQIAQPLKLTWDLLCVKHVLSISSSHLCEFGPILMSCSSNISSMHAASCFYPFLYSSSLTNYTIEVSPSADVCSTGRFGLFMVPRPLVSNWCTTWKSWGVGSFKSIQIFPMFCDCCVWNKSMWWLPPISSPSSHISWCLLIWCHFQWLNRWGLLETCVLIIMFIGQTKESPSP